MNNRLDNQPLQNLRQGIEPYRIGVLLDLPNIPGLSDMFPEGLKFAFQEAYESKLIDRPVELIIREFKAQPTTDGFSTINAYRDLVENEQVLAVAGPMTTDNCLAVLPYVEKMGVPNITICGSQLYVGEFAFNLSNGGMGDEPAVMAAWIAGEGYKSVAVVKDYPSQIAAEYMDYFSYSCAAHDIAIVYEAPASPIADQDEVTNALRAAKNANPDVLAHFGLGSLVPSFRPGLEELDWNPPRIMCTAFVGATYVEPIAHMLEGWVGVDQYDERNTVLAGILERYKQKNNGREMTPNSATSCGYDMGHVLSLAMSRMRIATPVGVRDALETIRRIPAATGAPETVITFGPQDHRGFKGPHFLILRRAVNGTTEFVGVAPAD